MPAGEEPRVYEIRIHGCASTQEAFALQEPIARVLCPDEWHEPPCDVPWGFTFDDDERADGEEAAVLVLGVYTSSARAAEVADRVRAVAGETRPAVVNEGDTERFEELVQQHRFENEPLRS